MLLHAMYLMAPKSGQFDPISVKKSVILDFALICVEKRFQDYWALLVESVEN